jgi:hypothetical protein
MRSLRWLWLASLMFLVVVPDALGTPPTTYPRPVSRSKYHAAGTTLDNSTHMDLGNIDMFVTNHGSLAYDLTTENAGFIYPKGGTYTAIYAAGLWLGAKVNGQVRCAIGEYSQEFVPGPMANGTYLPDVPEFKNYTIVRGDSTSPDYLNWPYDQGAPTDSVDMDGNALDPSGQPYGKPLLLGDEMIWSVFNDSDPAAHAGDAGSTAPLGVEVQQSVFAFLNTRLQNTIFIRWKILNKGGNQLDSMYVSFWSDPDLGGFTDDLVGCDTTVSVGYVYNATNADAQYGATPPSVGYDFFQGPLVQVSPVVVDTLGMVSFNKYINGTDPLSPIQTYNYMQGLNSDGTSVHVNNNSSLPITRYQVSGDPSLPNGPTNWIDSNPADRRLMLSSGPFTMMPGDSQDVYAAIIVGRSTNRLTSITQMLSEDAYAQSAFDALFHVPGPPPAPTVYLQALDSGVRLTWGQEPVGTVSAVAGRPELGAFPFEGFRVWQLSSNSQAAPATLIATFDNVDGITRIYESQENPPETPLKVEGTDSGLQFSLDIFEDHIRGGHLVNNGDYYFAVTAYSYDSLHVETNYVNGAPVGIISQVLESAKTPIPGSPLTSSAVFDVAAEPLSTGPFNLDGAVAADQLVQNAITGCTYQVRFDDQEHWNLWRLACPPTFPNDSLLLADQTNVSPDFANPVVDGFMPLITAPRGLAQMGELNPADSTLTDMLPENLNSTGVWYFADLGALAAFSFGGPTNHDYEIRILPDTTQYCWTYGSGEASAVANYKVPFEVIDLGYQSLSDTTDDVKISVMARDLDDEGLGDGRWSWGDAIYFREIPYASVDWTNPATTSTDYVPDGSDQTLGRFYFELADTNYLNTAPIPQIPPPATLRVLSQHFSSLDTYQFRTIPVATEPGQYVKNDLKKILAVPNPYYASSTYELTQFDRVLKFTNIPASYNVTIRIFNLGGDLVRTIQRQATSADSASTATIVWNLLTDHNLPVASGVYIYRVDVQGVGSKTDRVAVFIEQERLDNF